MQKTTKGAAAAGAAAVLLLGGAGSLAYWTNSADAAAGSISAGQLKLTSVTCDATWKYETGAQAGTTVTKIVPGDKVGKDCSFTIAASGDHLSATPSLPVTVPYTITSTPTPTTLSLPVAATYKVGLTPATAVTQSTITSADNAKALYAHVTVTLPFGTADGSASVINGNDTQNLTATLDKLKVALTQTQNGANPEN